MTFVQRTLLQIFRLKFRVLAFLSVEIAARQAFILFCTPRIRTERSLKMPVFKTADAIEFMFGRTRLRGFRWQGNTPRTVLLVHGFESDSGSFGNYVEPLLAKDFTVMAFDAPAHGFSEGSTINLLEYSQMLAEVLRNYPHIETVIAHSLGSAAASLAIAHLTTDRAAAGTVPQIKLAAIAAAVDPKKFSDQFIATLGLSRPVQERFYQMIVRLGGQPMEWYSMRRSLPQISAPVLLIHDTGDATCPYIDAAELAAVLPHVRFMETAGLGHNRIYRDTHVAERVIRFVSEP